MSSVTGALTTRHPEREELLVAGVDVGDHERHPEDAQVVRLWVTAAGARRIRPLLQRDGEHLTLTREREVPGGDFGVLVPGEQGTGRGAPVLARLEPEYPFVPLARPSEVGAVDRHPAVLDRFDRSLAEHELGAVGVGDGEGIGRAAHDAARGEPLGDVGDRGDHELEPDQPVVVGDRIGAAGRERDAPLQEIDDRCREGASMVVEHPGIPRRGPGDAEAAPVLGLGVGVGRGLEAEPAFVELA